jgi:hypothetical protein
VLNPIDRDVVYLVCQTEVYKSTDVGETWEQKDSGIDLHIGDQSLSDADINHCHPDSVFAAMIDFGAAGGFGSLSMAVRVGASRKCPPEGQLPQVPQCVD